MCIDDTNPDPRMPEFEPQAQDQGNEFVVSGVLDYQGQREIVSNDRRHHNQACSLIDKVDEHFRSSKGAQGCLQEARETLLISEIVPKKKVPSLWN